VFNTDIWLCWVNDNNNLLPKDTLEKSDQLAICAIRCLEVAGLDRHQRMLA
jgi:hypothetical protein